MKLTEADKDSVKTAIKRARLLDKSRQLGRIVRHTDPPEDVQAERDDLEKRLPDWLRWHGGEAFDREFSPDHERVLEKIARAIDKDGGGLFALAMPRGHGKTTILKWCTLYALLTGRRKYVVVVAATGELAQVLVEFCRQQITESDSLHRHYPHVTTYARATDGKAIKARFQLRADGKSSGIEWSKSTLVFPEVVGLEGQTYASSGAILEGHGLTGAIRGKWKDSKTGKVLRPDFVLLDDPQTRESAESTSQCDMRERIITGDVLGLAGPRKRIAAVMPCTVIRRGDLAARFLDHLLHPEWQGETCRLVNVWPTAQETLWKEYTDICREETANGRGFGAATAFYEAHRAEMEAGADVAWASRVRDGEVSSLQTAENLLIETGNQFWAEYQNEPFSDTPDAEYTLRAEHIVCRTNGQGRGVVTDDQVAVVAAVDLNRTGAAWMALSATSLPAYSVVDYDKWMPPGRRELWARSDKDSVEKAISMACEGIVAHLLQKAYSAKLDAITIDAGSDWARVVHAACKMLRQRHPAVKIWPAKGASGFQYDAPQRAAVIRLGFLADVRRKAYGTNLDTFLYWDSSYWHMATQQGWLAGHGCMGAITAFGAEGTHHQQLAEECSADRLVAVEYRGDRKQAEWKTEGPNHWGDCLAEAAALLSVLGIHPTGQKMKRVISAPKRDQRNADPDWSAMDKAASDGDIRAMEEAKTDDDLRRIADEIINRT